MPTDQTFRLSEDCSLRTIRTVRDGIAAMLAESDAVEIDCMRAEHVDLAFVQLITSAMRTAQREAKQLRVVNLSDAARTAFARAGLSAPASCTVAA